MKAVRISIVLLLAFAAVFFGGAWFYYSRREIPHEAFSGSVIPKHHTIGLDWIPVRWIADSLSDRSAMYIPVYVDTIGRPFWMQFDLGTPVTDFVDITQRFPWLAAKRQRLDHPLRFQDSAIALAGIDLRLSGGGVYAARHIPIYDQLDIETLTGDTAVDNKIGSLGYDIIDGRILVIDFRSARIAVTDSLPPEIARNVEYFEGAVVDRFPIYLPITIDGSTRLMKYDNGSSAFTMLLPLEQWNAWRRPGASVDTIAMNAWGSELRVCRSMPGVSISILGRERPAQPIWARMDEAPEQGGMLRSIGKFTEGMFGREFPGWIGNEYFRDDVLVFDTRHNRFGRMKGGL